MSTTTDGSNPPRTGSFGPVMHVYGLVLHCYITPSVPEQIEQVFGNVLVATQYPHMLVKLPSHNAKHILQSKLPELCARLNVDRIDVLDMSDWTVREFVLDTQEE